MVLLQRQQSCPTPTVTLKRRSSSVLPMGDDDDVYEDVRKHITPKRLSFSSPRQPPRRRSSNSSGRTYSAAVSLRKIILVASYVLALASCGVGLRARRALNNASLGLEADLEGLRAQQETMTQTLAETRIREETTREKARSLQSTKEKLQHELRVREEMMERQMNEDNRRLILEHLEQSHKATGKKWVQQRQETLWQKIDLLQEYIRQTYRQRVLSRYGPGPHRVEFRVRLPGNRKTSKFLVEMAPLSVVPHAVGTFLDMVTDEVWDGTLFYHHSRQSHIVAAAPVHYGTKEDRLPRFKALGHTGVAFPEYSPDFAHEEYTLGFRGNSDSPSFYVNTRDNAEHHGPEGPQDHHPLPNDADPCFAKIVWGKNVVRDMVSMSTGDADNISDPVAWEDFDLTEIVQVRIINEFGRVQQP